MGAITEEGETVDAPIRCTWPGLERSALYRHYHDTEWGVPIIGDDRRLLEKLTLEGFQSGLSWLTILQKREGFRAAFQGFDPEVVARFGEADVARLMGDAGIVRARAKIEAAIGNAQAYLALRETTTLSDFLWAFLPDGPVTNTWRAHGDVPATTATSTAMAKALKSRGFRFVGPTTAYAFMQSVGMVCDHLASCHRHGPCAALQAAARDRLRSTSEGVRAG